MSWGGGDVGFTEGHIGLVLVWISSDLLTIYAPWQILFVE